MCVLFIFKEEVFILNVAILMLAFFGLFAQLFSGTFISGMFLASISAIFISIASLKRKSQPQLIRWCVLILALTIIIGCVYDAYSYFSVPHMPGNNYGAWPWSLAIIICTLINAKNIWFTTSNIEKP